MTSFPSFHRLAAVSFAVVFVAAACGSDTGTATSAEGTATTAEAEAVATTAVTDATTSSTAATETGDGNTTAGVEAAQWSDNVEISIDGDTFTFVSDSLPSHEVPDQMLIPSGGPGDADPNFVATDTADLLKPVTIETEIPLNPVYSDETTPTSLGQIGVIISGAQLFNDYENMERTLVAVDDQTIIDGVGFLDSCNGHTLASGADYHYHGVPYCITDVVDVVDQHSTILGFVRDGFPVYGNKDVGGVTLTNDDLDECSGHVGPTPEFPEGIYHYHLTDDAAPYSIDCYHGVIDDSMTQGGGAAPGGGQAGGEGAQGAAVDLTDAAATLGVSVTDLEAALGQPPFDIAAAAAELGVTEDELQAVLPAAPDNGNGPPPGGGGGGQMQPPPAADDN